MPVYFVFCFSVEGKFGTFSLQPRQPLRRMILTNGTSLERGMNKLSDSDTGFNANEKRRDMINDLIRFSFTVNASFQQEYENQKNGIKKCPKWAFFFFLCDSLGLRSPGSDPELLLEQTGVNCRLLSWNLTRLSYRCSRSRILWWIWRSNNKKPDP